MSLVVHTQALLPWVFFVDRLLDNLGSVLRHTHLVQAGRVLFSKKEGALMDSSLTLPAPTRTGRVRKITSVTVCPQCEWRFVDYDDGSAERVAPGWKIPPDVSQTERTEGCPICSWRPSALSKK